jgi:lipopolysaccharide heptosyltransferase I
MKILIVRLSSFGDVVHTFPALTDLAAAGLDVEVDWLVDDSFAAIARLHPAVKDVIVFRERRLRWPPNRWLSYWRARRRLRRSLRDRHYDLVVDLQGLIKSATVARFAHAPIVGYDRKSIREPAASRFYKRKVPVSKKLHAVERNRRLLAAAIGYQVPNKKGSFGLAGRDRSALPLPDRFCVFIHSASWPSKHWPEKNWRQLVRYATEKDFTVVLPWGNEEEKARAERLAAGNDRALVLPHRLEGATLAAVIDRVEFAVGLDSGLMHLATALGVPGVWLFGPTDPGLTGPYGDDQIVVESTGPFAPCRMRDCNHGPNGRTCMDDVDFERVTIAIDVLLQEVPR